MAEGAKGPFFDREVELDEDLYVQLDLDDETVPVIVTYQQHNETAENAESAPPGLHVVHADAEPAGPRLPAHPASRPLLRRQVPAAPVHHRLRARQLPSDRAPLAQPGRRPRVGSGHRMGERLRPVLRRRRFHKYGVQARAYRIRRCSEDSDRYTRLRLQYPGSRPAYAKRTQILSVACLSSDV
jgi:hypothetical protein